jgi:hypothetical protein
MIEGKIVKVETEEGTVFTGKVLKNDWEGGFLRLGLTDFAYSEVYINYDEIFTISVLRKVKNVQVSVEEVARSGKQY